jgi:hypothetical protein
VKESTTMSTTTKRTLAYLRKLGFITDVVERRLPGCFVTRDLFGFADVLGVHPGKRVVLLVQTTTASNFAKRLRHVRDQPALPLLLAAGVRVEIWGWSKRGGRWFVRREVVQPGTLETVVVAELPDRRRRQPSSSGKGVTTKQPVTTERGACLGAGNIETGAGAGGVHRP